MIQPAECRHIMPSGLHCKSPAMRGSNFCYFHGRSQRSERARSPADKNFSLCLVLEAETAQQAYNEVLQALSSNSISNRRAALLFWGIQNAKSQSPNSPFPFSLDDEESIFPEALVNPHANPDIAAKP